MKNYRFLIITVLFSLMAATLSAQVVRRDDGDSGPRKKKDDAAGVSITDRQQAFYEVREPHDADLQWMKVIYRSLDLTVDKNPALYYPEEPNEDGQSLFFIIIRLLADGKLTAYEYLDGREMFTDEFKVKASDVFDRFYITYTPAQGSTEKNPRYTIEDADIPGNEILSYYIIEKWEFDTRTNKMLTRVDALCPVLHRTDEYGGEAIRYPMFWVKLNDIRPYMAQQYIFTDNDNNLARYSLDDFFKLNMYTGEIYKTKNMRNQSLRQLFPEDSAYHAAQDSIERRLQAFNNDLWVPDRETLLAQREAKEKGDVAAEPEGDGDGGDKVTEGTPEGDDVQATRRGEKVKEDEKTSKKQQKRRTNDKKTTVKQRKPKASKDSGSGGGSARSVRNRKR